MTSQINSRENTTPTTSIIAPSPTLAELVEPGLETSISTRTPPRPSRASSAENPICTAQ
ncbi:hypothetical protein ACIO87_38315 [Streptomyces sp. NPDC087218]|uniref:hypothetical protein n=1 Tax=Streptomyces sp. NPDC087218 TaxID=3365769 RepID=UPI003808FF45